MKFLSFLSFIVFLNLAGINAQHLIGFSKEKVQEIVRSEMKGLRLDNSSVNHSFNYLKFINAAGTKTLLVMFDEEDISTSVRLVSDYSDLNFIRSDYDSRYKKTGKESWEYVEENITYAVSMEKKEWY